MIELKDAIEKAKEFISEVYGQPEEVTLESAKPKKTYWLIKFRIPLSIKPINSLQNVLGINKRIFYKTVRIDKKGKVVEILDEDLPTSQSPEIQPQTV
jgi:hypothetical protein